MAGERARPGRGRGTGGGVRGTGGGVSPRELVATCGQGAELVLAADHARTCDAQTRGAQMK